MADQIIGPFNGSLMKNILKTKIKNQIQQIPSPRCIYGESKLIQTMNFIYDFKFQTEGPTSKMYSLQYDHEATDVSTAPNVIFFLYPVPLMVDCIASMIFKNESSNIKKTYWVYFSPLANYLCIQKIESMGIMDKINLRNFNFDFLPFNQDLLSLELSHHLDPLEQDNYIIESLMKMTKIVGKFRNFYALGPKSVKISKRLETTIEQIPQMEDAGQQSYMIILERSLDYITPMMTAFSYEGLLDLFFQIKFNQIEIPGHLIDEKSDLARFWLNNPRDAHYKNIAPMYIKDVPDYLKTQSDILGKKIKEQKDSVKTIQDLNKINQQLMPEFLLLQYHKNIVAFLLTHINSCQFINTATLQAAVIQSCQRPQDTQYLSVFYPIQQVMKLEVLSSQVSDIGSYYNRYEKKIYQFILNSYHPRHIITVKNLVDNGIIRNTKQPLKWKQICQKYDLLPDQPRSYTHIHIIYSALLVRFVEMFLTNNLNLDTINLISNQSLTKGAFNKIRSGDRVYLYLIGGITYPEIQAFRILGDKLKLKFIFCTSEITNGMKIIKKCF